MFLKISAKFTGQDLYQSLLQATFCGNTWRITVEAAVHEDYKDISCRTAILQSTKETLPLEAAVYIELFSKNSFKLLLVQT